ncbi:Chondroitin sulfate N-acetylgalactosaminyltransferase 2 [Armadillidium nasatum]|uniref:Hexosyltransferase n=1 Tax=Armadillidium nasatum TaxID=96803 RepID=A0A5N5T7Y4_9CRUS|nr:Chondroitin sulfate N-acetylgalactosaminyltransferase 2 [Armadillidium nasatum]
MKWYLSLVSLCSFLTVIVLVFITTAYLIKENEVYAKENEEVALGSDDINFPYRKLYTSSIPMQNFDDDYEYQISNPPKERITFEHKELFKAAINRAASKYNLKIKDFDHGSYRLLKNGIEYNLHFHNYRNRVSIFQPLSSSFHMKEIIFSQQKVVNIILPLKGKLSSLSLFLDNLVKKILPIDENISLTIVHFNEGNADKVQSLLKQKLSTVPKFEWKFIPTNETVFSRGKGLSLGVKYGVKSPSDLVFGCDVDVLFLPEFLSRCRSNTIFEHQVYFPVLFSFFNPKLVYSLYDKTVPDILDQLHVSRDNGFWRYYGFGMFCMHKKEFEAAGGIPEIYSWGEEDLIFFEQFRKFPSIKVIRSLDTSLFHIFHSKNCSNVRDKLYPSCLSSKASSEGTQIQLGLLLFKLHEGIDVEGILNKSCTVYGQACPTCLRPFDSVHSEELCTGFRVFHSFPKVNLKVLLFLLVSTSCWSTVLLCHYNSVPMDHASKSDEHQEPGRLQST